MIRKLILGAVPFLLFICCETKTVNPEMGDDDDGEEADLELSLELILEGTNFKELCGITRIDSTEATYHLYFDRNLCVDNVKRSGEIILTLKRGNHWGEPNAMMDITYVDFAFEKVGQQTGGQKKYFGKRSMTGKETVVNITGHTMSEFMDKKIDLLQRRITSRDLRVRFNDNPRYLVYNKAAIREIQRASDLETVTIKGDTSLFGYNDVQEWGVDRDNQRFINITEAPFVKTLCSPDRWILTHGVKVRYSSGPTKRTVYGVTVNGDVDGTCNAYGFKVTWPDSNGGSPDVIYKY